MAKVKTTTKKSTTKGRVATKKKVTTKATAKKKKVTAKPATKRSSPKFKRGYKVELVTKELTIAGEKDMYEVYQVSGKYVDKIRTFVDEASVQMFIEKCEVEKAERMALAGKGYQFVKGVIGETSDLKASAELPELNTEIAEDRYVAKNKEDFDK